MKKTEHDIKQTFFDTASISETHRRLLAEEHHVSESALRGWVRQGILPAARIGRTCLLFYPNVLKLSTKALVHRLQQQKPNRHTSRRAFRSNHQGACLQDMPPSFHEEAHLGNHYKNPR